MTRKALLKYVRKPILALLLLWLGFCTFIVFLGIGNALMNIRHVLGWLLLAFAVWYLAGRLLRRKNFVL
jgi:membrane-bound ClpP family serine protease